MNLAKFVSGQYLYNLIVGARSLEQLAGNLSAGEWDLPEDVWARLEAISSFDHDYPKQRMDTANGT